jgi:hypothetical protein
MQLLYPTNPTTIHARLRPPPSTPATLVISTEAKRSGETPVFALAVAFLVVIPQRSASSASSAASAFAFGVAVAFLSVIPSGNLLSPWRYPEARHPDPELAEGEGPL